MNLTRRFFLQSTGALAAYLGVAPLNLLAASGHAAPIVTKGKTLVVIFLRGGADGLNLVIPHGDPFYSKIRPTIAIPGPAAPGDAAARAIDLDGFYGLHPRLAPIAPLFEQGLALAAHAVGYDKNTRSHFEEQDTWETGIVGNTVSSDGWVNRHLATSEGRGTIRAVSIGDNLPRILHGKAAAYAIRGLDDLGMSGKGVDPAKVAAALEHAYCTPVSERRGTQSSARDLLDMTAKNTLAGLDELKVVTAQKYEPVKPYPKTDIGTKLLQMARLIKADVGLEVGEIDYGGWDTHSNQGRGVDGQYANLVGGLADALAAFREDLGDRMDDVLVVTLTDFGRTAAENGTTGTDHGWANCMLLMGGPVAAANKKEGKERKVVTTGAWPGLAPDQLHQKRDLLHTTDFRDVLCELVRVHLGNPHLETVLPQHEFRRVGLIA